MTQENNLQSSVVSVLLLMLALLQTVGRPVLTSGSDAVSIALTASDIAEAASASATESDCRTVDVLIEVA